MGLMAFSKYPTTIIFYLKYDYPNFCGNYYINLRIAAIRFLYI